jgi:hypothetical protein
MVSSVTALRSLRFFFFGASRGGVSSMVSRGASVDFFFERFRFFFERFRFFAFSLTPLVMGVQLL